MSDDCPTLTHFAGPRMDMAGRVIQRCAVCGAKLVDSRNAAVMLDPDGTVPAFPAWPPGRLVQIEAGNPTRSSLLPDTDRIPPDSCLDLA